MFGELIATWDRAKTLNAFEERHLDCLNIIVMRWNFGASNEILSFAFLLFLWDNDSQKLRIPSHFAKCEPLIRTEIHFPCWPKVFLQNSKICAQNLGAHTNSTIWKCLAATLVVTFCMTILKKMHGMFEIKK